MKNSALIKQFLALPLIAMSSAWSVMANADDEFIYINQDTYLKISTAQSAALADNQKCEIKQDNLLISTDELVVDNQHYQVKLANGLEGCGLQEGYLYVPHVNRPEDTLTVHTPTLLKVSALQESQLGDEEKCSLPAGVYALNIGPNQSQGHYSIDLKNELPNCGFSSGYVYEGHSLAGIQAIGITSQTVFKKTDASSDELTEDEKCSLPIGSYALSNPEVIGDKQHYRVTLSSNQISCGFSEGYVWYGHSSLPEPGKGEVEWFFPMPDAVIGSAWCQCRDIGTSPHIGQDVFKFGGMNAFATQDSTVEDISFSSSCGYIAMLRDQFDGLWRYVHLNNPNVVEGQQVSIGQNLASLSAYPTAGCGSGAHLHLERRSSGAFADGVVGKSCQNGFRTCYYDPMTPWRNGSGIDTTEINTADVAGLFGSAVQYSGFCKADPGNYSKISGETLSEFSTTQDLAVSARIDDSKAQPVVSLKATLLANKDNICRNDNSPQQCVTSWGMALKTTTGEYRRIFFDNSVRNQELIRDARENFCLPDDVTGDYSVFFSLSSGEKVRVDGALF